MQGGLFSYALLAALATALVTAAITDLKRRQIYNWLNTAIALGAPLFWFAAGLSLTEIGWQFAVAAAAFAVLAGMFAMGWIGGGDVKLLTALALWIEPFWFLRLIVIMALIGGLLAVILGGWHLARQRSGKIAVPYGIAISIAGLWVLAAQYLPVFRAGSQLG